MVERLDPSGGYCIAVEANIADVAGDRVVGGGVTLKLRLDGCAGGKKQLMRRRVERGWWRWASLLSLGGGALTPSERAASSQDNLPNLYRTGGTLVRVWIQRAANIFFVGKVVTDGR